MLVSGSSTFFGDFQTYSEHVNKDTLTFLTPVLFLVVPLLFTPSLMLSVDIICLFLSFWIKLLSHPSQRICL